MAHVYASLAEFKNFLREQGETSLGSNQDSTMLTVLESASRRIDEWCQRSRFGSGFGPRIGTNRYNGDGGGELWLDDDLASVTSITLRSGTAVVSTSSPVVDTDYYLLTGSGGYEPAPYRRLLLHGAGSISMFGIGYRVTDIAGTWGYPSTTRPITPTVAEALDASETEIDVSALTGISPGGTYVLESEQVYVTATTDSTTDSMTVVRGANGTTAATHLTGIAIARVIYDARAIDACNRLALRRWRSRDAGADGMDGGGQVGTIAPREGEDTILRRTIGDLRIENMR